jgi:hypothetical protein
VAHETLYFAGGTLLVVVAVLASSPGHAAFRIVLGCEVILLSGYIFDVRVGPKATHQAETQVRGWSQRKVRSGRASRRSSTYGVAVNFLLLLVPLVYFLVKG